MSFFGYIEDVTYVETVLKNSSKEEVTKFLARVSLKSVQQECKQVA